MKGLLLIATSAAVSLFASGANAEPQPAQARVVTLASALELARHNNGEFASKLTLLKQAEAREEQARAVGYPKVIGTAILSPIYSATGDALHSENDLSKWGVFARAG